MAGHRDAVSKDRFRRQESNRNQPERNPAQPRCWANLSVGPIDGMLPPGTRPFARDLDNQALVSKQQPYSATFRRARFELAARLRERSSEIEEAIFERVSSLARPPAGQPPDYVEGLRSAITEALDYAFAAIEHGHDWNAPIPIAAIAQARRAARAGISLETVLRRYHAGDRELAVFIGEEAHGLPPALRQEIQRAQSVPVDRLVEAVASEYRQEVERIKRSPASGLQERIRRLLANEVEIDPELDYDLTSWHVAIVMDKTSAEGAVRSLAKRLDSRILFVEGISTRPCAWLGRRQGLDVADVESGLEDVDHGALFALGESRSGIDGWRLTHFEARATFDTIRGSETSILRARDVVLAAAVRRDPVLTQALLSSYLTPLDEGREDGQDLRQTLRAYFATGQIGSAAELLGVERRTVKRRLQAVETRLGQRIEDCHAQLQVALQVEDALLRESGRGAVGKGSVPTSSPRGSIAS